ncbi:MAG: VWA domain-containing protein [Actinobacteria bacterium]|nr:VWA domain-containing protein [Actinomycetota bacterium]
MTVPAQRPGEPDTTPLDAHKVASARLWAAARHPYLASALFASTVVAVPGLGGASVDEAWRLYVDPDVVDTWTVAELGSLMVHHTGHLLRDHAGRARSLGVDHARAGDWALAADAEINDDLLHADLRLPGEVVLPDVLGCERGHLAEEYLRLGNFHMPDHPDYPDCGSGADAQPRPWELAGDAGGGLPPGERELLACQTASRVIDYAKGGRGRVATGWQRWAEERLDPRVDWRRVLAAEIRKGITTVAGRADYSYRRPSRRAGSSPDVVLPALERPVPEVAVLCDTSGSMTADDLARVLAEVEGLLRGVGVGRSSLRVLAVDAAVHTTRRVTSASLVELVGGGGTDMAVGIETATRLRPRPSVLVVLTDGMTPWPAEPPKGMEVVVGLVGAPGATGGGQVWATPTWARVVHVDSAA